MLDLLLLALNSVLIIISLIILITIRKTIRRSKSSEDLVDRINAIRRDFMSEVKFLRSMIESVKDSNVNVLSAIETKLKGLDRVMLSLEERLSSVVSEIKSSAVEVVDELDDLNCIFRDDGLIVYGSYDRKFVAYVTQALRALREIGVSELSIIKGDTIVHIKALGKFFCIKEAPHKVKFDEKKILKELGDIIGRNNKKDS